MHILLHSGDVDYDTAKFVAPQVTTSLTRRWHRSALSRRGPRHEHLRRPALGSAPASTRAWRDVVNERELQDAARSTKALDDLAGYAPTVDGTQSIHPMQTG